MASELSKNYDAAFYANQKAGSIASAEIVLGKLKPLLNPINTALDIGCGAGGWLKTLSNIYPDARIIGVDHTNVPNAEMFISADEFRGHDLSSAFDLQQSFDLVISLEVAEHIQPDQADVFIDNLTRHGAHILFSAATPRQGGTGHVNEQWPSYWIEKFAAHDYALQDVIRPLIWEEDAVASWYKQNILLFVRKGADFRADNLEDWGGRAMIHPGLWARKTEPLKEQIMRAVSGRKPDHAWRRLGGSA